MNLVEAMTLMHVLVVGRALTAKERTAMARQLFASDVWTAKCPKGCLPRVDFGRWPDFRVQVWCAHQSTEGKASAEEAAQAWNAGEVKIVYWLAGPEAAVEGAPASTAEAQPGKGGQVWEKN